MMKIWKNFERDESVVKKIFSKLFKERGKRYGIVRDPDIVIKIKELQAYMTEGVSYEIIDKSIKFVSSYVKDHFYEFEHKIDSLLKESAVSTWEIIIPTIDDFPIRKIRIDNVEMDVLDRSEATSTYRIESEVFKKEAFGVRRANRFIICKSQGNSLLEAFNNRRYLVGVLYGIFDYVENQGTHHYIGDGRYRSQINRIEYVFGISQDAGWIRSIDIYNPAQSANFLFSFEEEKRKRFNEMVERFSDKISDNSTMRLIANCYRLYHEALIEINDSQVFLSLWQLLECLTLAFTKRGNTDNVINRTNLILEEIKNPYQRPLKKILNSLKEKRNEYVHTGLSSIDLYDINILKEVCENCIFWLLHMSKYIRSQKDLEIYFSHATMNSSDLKRKLSILSLINENRP